jgi:hypothetical protein
MALMRLGRLGVLGELVFPEAVRLGGRYYLTIRNDLKGYVTAGGDGLHYRPVKPWTFDDGADLGSYNTQQHWLAHGEGLFLVYTRRGANNDHIMRHRAPLFIAQVDPERLQVIRETERVLVPERGAELGNFGAAAITDRESWVTVAEGVWDDAARRRGAKGAVFVVRVTWHEPASEPALPKSRAALESGGPVRVCFGDSVTGVYYHTGSRRAYADMLAIALRRTYGQAWVMNSSLSFGAGGWDCVVVHPAVFGPDRSPADGRDALIRRLVRAQDLALFDRRTGEERPCQALLRDWLRRRPWRRE